MNATRRDCKRVLVIDEEEGVVRLLRAVLAETGCEVVGAGHPEHALEAIKGGFDAVLVDAALPARDVMEILAHLRRDHPRTKRVLLTAGSLHGVVREFYEALADELLEKPFSLPALYRLIEGLKPKARK